MRDDGSMTEEASTTTRESRHVSVWLDVSPATAYTYVSDPTNLPYWAAGLASGEIHYVDGSWVVSSPMGEVKVEFAPTNEFGVVDHVVRMAGGEVFYNPMPSDSRWQQRAAMRSGVHRAPAWRNER